MSNPYTHSAALGAKLAPRSERIGHVSAPHQIVRCKRASDTIVLLGDGTKILVSYETPVALRKPDGSAVATPYGQFSRTTDRAIGDFCSNPERISVSNFNALVQPVFA